jgi:hypothetical protein
VRRRLQQARQVGDEQTVNMLRRRLRLLTVGLGGQRPVPELTPAETTEPEVTGPADRDTAPEMDVQQVVQSAYLRTLSRYPTDSEMATCVAFFDESENKISAARDLLWALINTKEFIVNH